MTDVAVQSVQDRVRSAATAKTPLAIRGGGTRDFYGQAIVGDVVDMKPLAGIVDYDPTELVVTARAGTPVAEIDDALAARGQMLGCDAPRFGPGATFGGLVATGLSGPRRPYAGAVRDLILGVRIVDGKGDDLSFGGRVMKNVAGFDVARLMTGALGTLGIIIEISMKCLPLPKVEATRMLECTAEEAIRQTNEWGGKPLPISATCHYADQLFVRISASAPALDAVVAKIGGSPVDDGSAFWESIRDHTHRHFADAVAGRAALWRLSVKSTAPHRDLGGDQLIEWGGALRWLVAGPRTDAGEVRAWAQGNGGHATLFRAADKSVGVFHPLPRPIHELHRRLKTTFDPAGILNRSRLYPDF